MKDLASRLVNRVQLTTDGHAMYLDAVPKAFGKEIDYSQLIKIYGSNPESEIRYSPPKCTGIRAKEVIGYPEGKNVSTSYV